MKTLTAVLVLPFTLLVGAVHADTPITEERCRHLHEYSTKAMEARQLDLSVIQVLDTADGNTLKEHVIRAAYREPSYLTEAHKQRAIQEFATMMYLDCLDAMSLEAR